MEKPPRRNNANTTNMGIRKFINHSIKFRTEINNSASECTFMLQQWHAMYEFGKLDFVHYIVVLIITKFAHVASEYSKVESPALPHSTSSFIIRAHRRADGRTDACNHTLRSSNEYLVRHSLVPNTASSIKGISNVCAAHTHISVCCWYLFY